MRPKVVISIMVVAFGLIGLIALFKGVTGKNPSSGETAPVVSTAPLNSTATNNPPAVAAGNGNPPAISPEIRDALVENELARIRELQDEVDGTNNPIIIAALLEKFLSPEREVRIAALQALKEMDDTNAVPGLEKAEASLSDAREKVAVLDAIDYIKLPSATQNVPPELQTNYVDPALIQAARTNTHRKHPMNPAFLKGMKNGRQSDSPGVPAASPQ
jgi:hypothetical protein